MGEIPNDLKFDTQQIIRYERCLCLLCHIIMENKITELGRYFIRIQLENKKFVTKFFNSEDKLFNYLKSNPYLNCYYSKNQFYFSKDTKKNLNKNDNYRILKKFTVIDIDDTDKENVRKIIELVKPYNILYILQTSKGSVQIKLDYSQESAIKRLLEENNVQFCNSTFKHDLWIVRYPNTLNRGFKPFYLDEDLSNFVKREDKIDKQRKKREEYWSFIRQELSGVKDRFIFCFKSPIIEERRIRYLQKQRLGDVYILKDGKENLHLFVKTMSKKRLNKFSKKEVLIRVSEKRLGKEIYEKKPELIKVIKNESEGDFSKPHMNFIRKISGDKSLKYESEIGKGMFGMTKSEVIENG